MDHYLTLFVKRQGICYMQCPIDRTSHTWPLLTLLGASDDRRSKPLNRFCSPSSLSGPSTSQESNHEDNLVSAGSPLLSPSLINTGYCGPFHNQTHTAHTIR